MSQQGQQEQGQQQTRNQPAQHRKISTIDQASAAVLQAGYQNVREIEQAGGDYRCMATTAEGKHCQLIISSGGDISVEEDDEGETKGKSVKSNKARSNS